MRLGMITATARAVRAKKRPARCHHRVGLRSEPGLRAPGRKSVSSFQRIMPTQPARFRQLRLNVSRMKRIT
jgi:hypothetical protein